MRFIKTEDVKRSRGEMTGTHIELFRHVFLTAMNTTEGQLWKEATEVIYYTFLKLQELELFLFSLHRSPRWRVFPNHTKKNKTMGVMAPLVSFIEVLLLFKTGWGLLHGSRTCAHACEFPQLHRCNWCLAIWNIVVICTQLPVDDCTMVTCSHYRSFNRETSH